MTEQRSIENKRRTAVILPWYRSYRVDNICRILNKMQYKVERYKTLQETTRFCCEQFASINCIISALNLGADEFKTAEFDTIGGLFAGHAWLWEVVAPLISKFSEEKPPRILTFTDEEDALRNRDLMKMLKNNPKAFFHNHNRYIIYDETQIESELRKHLGG